MVYRDMEKIVPAAFVPPAKVVPAVIAANIENQSHLADYRRPSSR